MNGDEGSEGAQAGGQADPGAGSLPTFETLQERLAEHGRKLAEAAGGGLEAEEDLAAAAPVAEQLDLHEGAPLPWLESADDDDDFDGGIDTRRVAIAVGGALALLVAIVGGIWWGTHRNADAGQVADGSLIKAPPGPYKTAPANPGGKTYDGTGDSSYAVSQGKNPVAHLAGDGTAEGTAKPEAKPASTPSAAPSGKPSAAASGAAAGAAHPATGGVGVQVGAYTNQASAEAGWARLEKQATALSGVRHRVVQGQADIGTVYRLQAVTENDAAATALCSALKAQGVSCQVRH